MTTEYQIVIRGPVSDSYLDEYRDEFAITTSDTHTTLCGHIRDSSQLHGIVAHLTKVGLELVEIRSSRVPEPDQ